EGRHLVRQVMLHEPIEIGRPVLPEIPLERQHVQLAIAAQHGIVQRKEEHQGLRRTYWTINPRFRPVLEDVLYAPGRLSLRAGGPHLPPLQIWGTSTFFYLPPCLRAVKTFYPTTATLSSIRFQRLALLFVVRCSWMEYLLAHELVSPKCSCDS